MEYEHFDAAIGSQMTDVITLLDDHDLVPAEAGMHSLLEQVNKTAPERVREQKLVNLRQRLQSGVRHIQRIAPLTAVIRFREALRSWLAE
jgi:hypothetical protein